MDLRTKELLIEKYWNGTSSQSEEQLLKRACSLNPELFSKEEQSLFAGIAVINTLELPSNFSSEFLDKLEYKEAHEKYAVSSAVNEARVISRSWMKPIMKIAATMLLLVGLGVGYHQFFPTTKTVTSLNPSERAAFEESQKALMLIAQKMDKVKLLSSALEKFDVTQDKIRR